MYSTLQIGINNDHPSFALEKELTSREFIGEIYHENFIHRNAGGSEGLYISGHT